MKLVAVLATLLYVVDPLQVENKTTMRPSLDNSYVPFISKKSSRVKRPREHETPDKEDPVDVLMLEHGGKKKKIHHVHTTDSSPVDCNTTEKPGVTEKPDVTEEPEDPEDLEYRNSGNPVCARLQEECYAACEHKRDLCEEWRSLAAIY